MVSPSALRLAVGDDVEVVTAGLAEILAPFSDRITLTDHLGFTDHRTAGSAVAKAAEPSAADIFLIDPSLHRRSVAELVAAYPSQRVVVYAWTTDLETVTVSLIAGASGVLHKGLSGQDLVLALERIAEGKIVVGPGVGKLDVRERAEASAGRGPGPRTDWPGQAQGLTLRESEVVGLITSGWSNHQIAEHLYFSINTVKSYIRGAYAKMQVSSRTHAVLWGLQHGFSPERLPVLVRSS